MVKVRCNIVPGFFVFVLATLPAMFTDSTKKFWPLLSNLINLGMLIKLKSEMMKTISFAILVVLISLASSSCIYIGPSIKGNGNVIEETRELTGFKKIKASAGTNVYISQGDVEKVVVKADENLVDYIKTEVDGGVLIVTNTRPIRKATVLKVYVTIRDIEKISAVAGSNVYSETKLESGHLELSGTAGSNLKLDISAGDIEISSLAGSNIYVEGKAGNLKVSASAGSNIKAEGLESQTCLAKANSGANVYVSVVNELEAKANSGGNVFYYGTPKQLNVSSSSGGNVIKR